MSVELKPCPFCGNKTPVLMKRHRPDIWRDWFYVLCDYNDGGCGASGQWNHCTDEAVEAWNRRVYLVDKQPTIPATRWHRVEEPPKEHGPFLCAAKYERNGQTHWFFELCWYADGDLKDVVFDAEQDSGFYSWSASQDRDIDSKVDYWMPIEPPKEDE